MTESTNHVKNFLLFIGLLITIIIPTNTYSANADPGRSRLVYGCIPQGQHARCDPLNNEFSSLTSVGHVQRISTVNLTKSDPIEGVFGSALAINGYKQEFFTVQNKPELNPKIFSLSFWMKQDPIHVTNSAIISHVNAKKTAGWYFQLNVTKTQTSIQFSVTNTDGKIFTVSSPFETGVFQNVVGTFDGRGLKIYLNGYLKGHNEFAGNYIANPDVPLNVGLNSFDYRRPWTGLIDELRFYNFALSDSEVQKFSDYGAYLLLSRAPDDALIGYWPFEGGLIDKSGNRNDGKIVLLAVSMVFSPYGKLYFSIRDGGEIKIMTPNFSVLKEPFVRLQDPSTNTYQEIRGITLDPDFLTNHFVYAYVGIKDNSTGISYSRVMRFTETDNIATDPKVLIDNIPTSDEPQFAGAVAFGPDDKLYVTTSYSAKIEDGQNANLTGKVLRINRDGTIPPDNPFPNSPIYSLGHRSIFGIAFDNTTRMGMVSENDARNDVINVLKKGGDYSFPAGVQHGPPSFLSAIKRSETDNSIVIIKPARTYYTSYYSAVTPTQAIFYDGNKFPALKGKFLTVSYGERSIYAFTMNSTGNITEELAIRFPEVQGHLVSIANGPDGEIYVGGENLYKFRINR